MRAARGGLLAVLLIAAGCGYRPVGRGWPAQVGRIRVMLPEATALAEPELARMLAVELGRSLGRAGARPVTSEPAEARLHCRLLGLQTNDSPLDPSGRSVAARVLRLRLELRLAAAAEERTLWRSGLLEVEELWSLSPSGPALSEEARRRTLQRLAARAAEQAVELLESAPPR